MGCEWIFFERTTEDTEVEKKEVFTSDLGLLYISLYFTLIFYSNIYFFLWEKQHWLKY